MTIFDVRNDRNLKLAEVLGADGTERRRVPAGRQQALRREHRQRNRHGPHQPRRQRSAAAKHITVGTEPYGLALTPNGTKLYVSNARSNTISVIDTASDTVTKTITVNAEPRGLAITNDGDADDNDETVYVTHFLSFPHGGKIDGQDDAKVGRVSVMSTTTDTRHLRHRAESDRRYRLQGARRRARAHRASGQSGPADFTFTTGAYPNQLNSIGIKGNFAFVPNTGASPNGPVRFDVNTHSLLSVLNRNTNSGRRANAQHAHGRQGPDGARRSCSSRSRGRSRSRTPPTKAT